VRVEGNSRLSGNGYAGAPARLAPSGAFGIGEAAPAQRAANAVPVAVAGGLEALLALQAVDEPVLARRKALRRGRALLDSLEAMQTDILGGRVGEGRLNQLAALVGQAREGTQPGLDSLLDDIDLRVRVELAKLGRFASA
jgi:hypothetical protein